VTVSSSAVERALVEYLRGEGVSAGPSVMGISQEAPLSKLGSRSWLGACGLDIASSVGRTDADEAGLSYNSALRSPPAFALAVC